MSLESRVDMLESKHHSLDYTLRDLIRVVGATHEVVALILKEQLAMRKEQIEMRAELCEIKAEVSGRFDQLELLIRQSIPAN